MSEHQSGIFHAWCLDDGETWVDIYGREHYVSFLDQDYAENILRFLLHNAQRFQRVYMIRQEGIDPDELDPSAFAAFFFRSPAEAERWMLRTPLAYSLMRRLLEFSPDG